MHGKLIKIFVVLLVDYAPKLPKIIYFSMTRTVLNMSLFPCIDLKVYHLY